jgi:hypothetical protein
MSNDTLLDELAALEPRQRVILTGYPDGGESEWLVNDAPRIGSGQSLTKIVVLQAGDASEHWVAVILNRTKAGWELERLSGFEGEKPSGLTADEHGTDLDPDSIEVVEVRET